MAYDAAVKALSQQDTTLGNLRNRASGLLSAAALATSFSAGLGLIQTDPAKGKVLPIWAALSLFGVLLVIATLSMAILWPVQTWHFGPDSGQILQKVSAGTGIDEIRAFVAGEMTTGRSDNARALSWRMRCYRLAVALLIVEVGILVAAVATR